LEDVLKYEYLPGWQRLMKKLESYFDARWEKHWQKGEVNLGKPLEGFLENNLC